MEVALVSATTGALQPVVEKLASLLRDKYKHFKGVCNLQRKEIELLTRELVAMDAFLLKMSEEEDPDVQSKVWMNEVRELSYDMEDSIDDYMQSGNNKDTRPNGFMEKIKHSLGKMKVRRRITCEIKDMKNQIIEVGERNARYKTPQAFSNTRNGGVDPRALVIFENASKLVGIGEPKAEIIKLLMQDDGCVSTEQKLKIISIVGSGGMGKTTLANQVYQDLKGHFEWHTFLSVSRNPDIMNILRIILSEVSGQGYASTKSRSIQQLIIKINNSLRDKRCNFYFSTFHP
jgi:disease resistance protein RPM1